MYLSILLLLDGLLSCLLRWPWVGFHHSRVPRSRWRSAALNSHGWTTQKIFHLAKSQPRWTRCVIMAVRLVSQVIRGEAIDSKCWRRLGPSCFECFSKVQSPKHAGRHSTLCTWYASYIVHFFVLLVDSNKSSWASYNLVSACTACPGFLEQIPQ
jgi:hypothetical protein